MNIFSKLFFKLEKIVDDLLWIIPILLLAILTGHSAIAFFSTLLS